MFAAGAHHGGKTIRAQLRRIPVTVDDTVRRRRRVYEARRNTPGLPAPVAEPIADFIAGDIDRPHAGDFAQLAPMPGEFGFKARRNPSGFSLPRKRRTRLEFVVRL